MGLGNLGWNWQQLPQEFSSWGRGTVAEEMEVRSLEVGWVLYWERKSYLTRAQEKGTDLKSKMPCRNKKFSIRFVRNRRSWKAFGRERVSGCKSPS